MKTYGFVVLAFTALLVPAAAPAGVLYVAADGPGGSGNDWSTALRTISAALAIAAAGDEIRVKGGTYAEVLTLKSGVALYGGYLGQGDTRDWTAAPSVLDASGFAQPAITGADDARLDGFYITGGTVRRGAGLYCRDSSPTVVHCTFTGMTAEAGEIVSCDGGSPTLVDCAILDNRAVGIYCVFRSAPVIRDCTIARNDGGVYCGTSSTPRLEHCTVSDNSGTGLHCINASPVLVNCRIAGNRLGGVHASGSEAVLTGCTIESNRAERGAGFYCYRSSIKLESCVIRGNRAEITGGGLYCDQLAPVLVNCILVGNSAEYGAGVSCINLAAPTMTNCTVFANRGGGLHTWMASPKLVNCILWNRGAEVSGYQTHRAQVRYSCVQGGWTGEGNIDAHPRLDDDYRPGDGSSCIGRGDAASAPAVDAYGAPRPGGDGRVDIGACETAGNRAAGPAAHEPRRLYVRTDAPSGGDGATWGTAFGSVGAALEAAGSGDSIFVAEGRYAEALHLEPVVALCGGFAGDESVLEERDLAAHATVLDASGLGAHAAVGANSAVLDGFTLTGGQAPEGGGLYCFVASPVVRNCRITANRAGREGGGVWCDGGAPELVNCVIDHNLAGDRGGAGYFQSALPVLRHCTVVRNTAREGCGGLYVGPDASPVVVNSILADRGAELAGNVAAADVRYSCVQGGHAGTGNLNGVPLFVDAAAGDYRPADGSPCIGRAVEAESVPTDADGRSRPGGDGTADLGAYEAPDGYAAGPAEHIPRVLYVRPDGAAAAGGSDWSDAFDTPASALDHGGPGDEIWVAAGRYAEPLYLESDVALYGGFSGDEATRDARDPLAHAATIDATDFATHAVVGADRATLDGFTLTGGRAARGGGVFCNGTSPALARCRIAANTAHVEGGGVYAAGAEPVLTDCVLEDNTAPAGGAMFCNAAAAQLAGCAMQANRAGTGGAVAVVEASPELRNCRLRANEAGDGGAVACVDASPVLAGCEIAANTARQGAGIYCLRSFPLLSATTIRDGSGVDGGGLFCERSSPSLVNCTIVRNRAEKGGGAYCFNGSSPDFTHCTLAGNERFAVYTSQSSFPSLVNCILWGDVPEELYNGCHDGITRVDWSCIEGGYEGEGDFSADPRFVAPERGDYRLLSESSCRDGAPCLDGVTTDADGSPRPAGGGCDFGAYEYRADATPTPTATHTTTRTATQIPTRTPTQTPTGTPTVSPTSTDTLTATASPTSTPTPSATLTPSASPSATPSDSPSPSASPTLTVTPTGTLTPSRTPSATASPTQTPTATKTPTGTQTWTAMPVSADLDGDGVVDERDLARLIAAMNGHATGADLTGDGTCNARDVLAFSRAWMGPAARLP